MYFPNIAWSFYLDSVFHGFKLKAAQKWKMDFVVARLLKKPLKRGFDKVCLHNLIYCKGLKIIQRNWKKKKKKKKNGKMKRKNKSNNNENMKDKQNMSGFTD